MSRKDRNREDSKSKLEILKAQGAGVEVGKIRLWSAEGEEDNPMEEHQAPLPSGF